MMVVGRKFSSIAYSNLMTVVYIDFLLIVYRYHRPDYIDGPLGYLCRFRLIDHITLSGIL